MISVGQGFSNDLRMLEQLVSRWESVSKEKVFKAFRRIGVAWKAEAQKRIPVDTGMARQHVLTNTYWDSLTNIVTETGSNLLDKKGFSYPAALEFGTKWIAKGKVKALGDSPLITDSQAIHTWAAKEGDATEKTSASFRKISGSPSGARFNRGGRFVGSGPQEQMPWLRPAFNRIRSWAEDEINKAMEIPR